MNLTEEVCPLVAFDAALGGEPCEVVGPGRRLAALATKQWFGPCDEVDQRLLLSHCQGPTLDVGCGPGRMTAALLHRGTPTLGIDVSAVAVQHAVDRGAPALRRNVFAPVPASGRWNHVLLADGNVGIGGDPIRLLRRSRELVRRGGTVVVELSAPGTGLRCDRIRLRVVGRTSTPFPWSLVGVDAIELLAKSVELAVVDVETTGGRWAAVLRRPLTEGKAEL